MKKIDRTEIFERLPVQQAVIRQIVPAIASQMITLIYNLADAYFVGMLNMPSETAGVSLALSLTTMLTALSNLFGVGGASLVAASLGQGKPQNAKHISSLTFWGGLMCGVAYSLLFLLFTRPLLTVCGATADTYAQVYGYTKWVILIGGPFTVVNILMANLVRSEGRAAYASMCLSFGGILNIILDPFFVLPRFFGMGAEGAGLATAISNMAVTALFMLYLYRSRSTTVLSISPVWLKYAKNHIRKVLSIGLPSALQYALAVIAVAALSKFVSGYNTEAVAALGIVKRLDQLPLYFSIGVGNGLLPLLSYNHAAKNHLRRSEAFKFGAIISLSFSLLCFICYELFAPALIRPFMDNPATIAYGAAFLRIQVAAMPATSICYPITVQFQAMGKVKEALTASVIRKGILDIPLLFAMNALLPLYGCMWVQPIVDTIALVVVLLFYRRIQAELFRQSQNSEEIPV